MSGGLTQAAVDRLGLQVGELLAEHAGPETEDFQKWADDPVRVRLKATGATPQTTSVGYWSPSSRTSSWWFGVATGQVKNGWQVRSQSGLRTVVACWC